MRDDVFILWDQGDQEFDCFYWYLLGINPKIQFTLEKEVDKRLPFLDMDIKREETRLITKVYRKPTHTQQYIHWRSNHPKNLLLGVLKGLIHRAHQLCDLKEDLLEELALLKDVFISNGYPEVLVQKTIKSSWEKETLKTMLFESNGIQDLRKEKEDLYDVFHAPYIQGFSEGLQKKLRRFNVGFIPMKSQTLHNKVCHLKPVIENEEKKDLVYAIRCSTCNKYYIGETSQHFTDRKSQHARDIKNKKATNGIFQHLKANKKHKIDWESINFIDSEKHWLKRKIKESLYINALNPKEEVCNIMNLEKGLSIHNCWKYFNDEIKTQTLKRLASAA
jgi:hypothetical protein